MVKLGPQLLIKIFCFCSCVFLFEVKAAPISSELVLKKNNGTVKFLAKGFPSAINITGESNLPEGKITIVTNEKTSVINGHFSLDLNSFATGMDMRDSHMKEKYLETDKFPKADFEIDTLDTNGSLLKTFLKKSLPFSGKLNLHGTIYLVKGMTEIEKIIENDKETGLLKIVSKFKIKTSDFKISTPSFAGITVADEVDIQVELKI